MVVLIDSNIILDYMLKNQGFFEDAEDVLVLAESGKYTGYVSASAITDIYYIARKAHGSKEKALSLIRELLDSVHVALVDEGVIRNAVDLEWNDFEDAVQFSVGSQVNADYIVTRDPKGFSGSKIEVADPKSLISMLASE
ncbi:MAG: PIN domain-containing protein [Clostridiales Family XIII bacterium]|jgi:predicted nucleic acid-binding protein|nr:PIN domain-containing protein [Clostridiales Family XIII bacterium]